MSSGNGKEVHFISCVGSHCVCGNATLISGLVEYFQSSLFVGGLVHVYLKSYSSLAWRNRGAAAGSYI